MFALYLVLLIYDHVVTQIIKPQLVVGAVGDIRIISRLAILGIEIMNDQTDGQAEIAIYLAHPLTVAAGQVVVDRDHMHALSGQCVEVGGQNNRLRFTFTGFHFGDTALVQNDTAQNLHGKVWCSQYPVSRFTADGKSVGKNIVQRLPRRQAIFEQLRLTLELTFRHGVVFVLERQHLIANRLDALNFSLAVIAEQHFHQSHC